MEGKVKQIVPVHGFSGSYKKDFGFAEKYFSNKGVICNGFSYLQNKGQVPIEEVAREFGHFVDQNIMGDFIPIGISQGALITGYWLENLDGKDRCDKCVTISAPLYGTVWANLHPTGGIGELRIGSPFLKDLRNRIEKSDVDYYSVWNPLDPAIVPGRSGNLEYAKENISVKSFSHARTFRDIRTLEFIDKVIQQ